MSWLNLDRIFQCSRLGQTQRKDLRIEKTLHQNHLLPVTTSDAGRHTDDEDNAVQRPVLVKRITEKA